MISPGWRGAETRVLGEPEFRPHAGDEALHDPVNHRFTLANATYQVLTWAQPGCAEDADLFERHPHLALFDQQQWGLIVYDEVHLLPAPVFRATARIQAVRRLGLTATLVREDAKEADVFSLIGPKRYDAPWSELEAQGWIAPASCTEIRVELSDDLRMEYAVAEPQQRYRIAATSPAKLVVLERLLARHATDRVLVIGQYLDQVRAAAEMIGAPLITGQTSQRVRDERFEAFRNGDLNQLVVSKVANFSIDLPEANVAIQISGAFGSRQEEAQRLGRILRPKADAGAAHFYTITARETVDQTFAANRQRFLRAGLSVHDSRCARTFLRALTRAPVRAFRVWRLVQSPHNAVIGTAQIRSSSCNVRPPE